MYLPLWMEVEGKTAVIIGGGEVALRRGKALAAAGAKLTLIAPDRVQGWQELAVDWLRRPYQSGDLKNCDFAVVATDNPSVNQQALKEGQAAGVLVNAAASAANGDLLFPAVIREGGFTVALSSEGQTPFLSKRLKREIGDVLAAYDENLIAFLARERRTIIEKYPEEKETLLRRLAELPLAELRELMEKGAAHGHENRLQREQVGADPDAADGESAARGESRS